MNSKLRYCVRDDICASCGGILPLCTCRRVGEKPLQLALGAVLSSTCRSFSVAFFPFHHEVPDEREEKETEGATHRPTNDWPEIFVRPRYIRFNLFRELYENQRTLNSTTFQDISSREN